VKKIKFVIPFLFVFALFFSACSAKQPTGGLNQPSPTPETSNTPQESPLVEDDISEIKEYIMNGQGDKPEEEKLNWSESFLNKVDLNSVYKDYISSGGNADDIESIAKYLTLNAPVPENWKELFEADLLEAYGQKVSKYEQLQDNLYQVYVKNESADVPYVVVNTRTGYYHG